MFEFALVCLGSFRVTYMLIDQEGPLKIFERIRKLAAKQPNNFQVFNFECPYCLSVWVSLPGALLLASGIYILVYWLAIAATVMYLYKLSDV